MKKIITVFTICLVASVNAMEPENRQNIHNIAPVTQQNYVQPRQVNQLNQNYNLPTQTQILTLQSNIIQENMSILRPMQNQQICRQHQLAIESKPKKADAKDKKTAQKSKKVKKLTQDNLQDMQKLTRWQVNNRIREYIKDGKTNMQNGTVSYLTPPIY